jgi:hypothetical protein
VGKVVVVLASTMDSIGRDSHLLELAAEIWLMILGYLRLQEQEAASAYEPLVQKESDIFFFQNTYIRCKQRQYCELVSHCFEERVSQPGENVGPSETKENAKVFRPSSMGSRCLPA